jgi:hypothetical protein
LQAWQVSHGICQSCSSAVQRLAASCSRLQPPAAANRLRLRPGFWLAGGCRRLCDRSKAFYPWAWNRCQYAECGDGRHIWADWACHWDGPPISLATSWSNCASKGCCYSKLPQFQDQAMWELHSWYLYFCRPLPFCPWSPWAAIHKSIEMIRAETHGGLPTKVDRQQ